MPDANIFDLSMILSWWSLGTTVLFGVLSVYFFMKSRDSRRIVCSYDLVTLQTKTHPEVDIQFHGESVTNLSRMLVVFWNAGNREIRDTDVPRIVYPRLSLAEKSRIFSVATLESSSEHIEFSVTQESSTSVRCHFRFLNPGDGGVAEILFERASQYHDKVDFSAPVMGGQSGVACEIRAPQWPYATQLPLVVIIAGSGVFLMIQAIMAPESSLSPNLSPTFALIFGAGLFLFPVYIMHALWRDAVRHRLPEFAKQCLGRKK